MNGSRRNNTYEFVRRVEVEAQRRARFEHPHVVPLHDFWRDPDGAYLVMPYLRGGSLRDRLEAGALEVDMLRRLSDYHQIPVLAVHAPCLYINSVAPWAPVTRSQRVFGRDPWGKLLQSKDMAEALGANVVVVHPAFRKQRGYAREFESAVRLPPGSRVRRRGDAVVVVAGDAGDRAAALADAALRSLRGGPRGSPAGSGT